MDDILLVINFLLVLPESIFLFFLFYLLHEIFLQQFRNKLNDKRFKENNFLQGFKFIGRFDNKTLHLN